MLYNLFPVVILALIVGCTEDNDFISIDEFELQVTKSVGEEAVNCGKVAIGESPLVVNTCVSDSFVINTPFYAFYVHQGTDSSVVSAITMNSNDVVEYWSYDSDISGGSNGGSKVSTKVCETPSVGYELDSIDSNVFYCSN